MKSLRFSILLGVLAGCGGGTSAVYLTVDSVAPVSGVDRLRVVVVNNGMTSMATEIPLTGRPVAIPPAVHAQLRFEGARSGSARIQVDAADANGKVLASGVGMADLQAGREVEARVVLGGEFIPSDGGVPDMSPSPDLRRAPPSWTELDYNVGNQAVNFAVIDLNRDAVPDVAITVPQNGGIAILLGMGDGQFKLLATLKTPGFTPETIASADFNGDGLPDFVATNAAINQVAVVTSGPNGTYAAPVLYPTDKGPARLALADVNGDGRMDIAVSSTTSNTVSLLTGNGKGAFSGIPSANTGAGPVDVVTADFNLDGKADLATGNAAGNDVSVLLGDGAGAFTVRSYKAGSRPDTIAAADINRDGKADLIVLNNNDDVLSFRLGNGDGTFGVSQDLAVPDVSAMSAGDVDGDGAIDLILSAPRTNEVRILFGTGMGTFAPGTVLPTRTMPFLVGAADFNNDRVLDLIVTTTAPNIMIFRSSK